MMNPLFKKCVVFSALWHLATFGVFGLSFGPRMKPVSDSKISFWGGFLSPAQLNEPLPAFRLARPLLNKPVGFFSRKTEKPKAYTFDNYCLKPYSEAPFITEKRLYAKEAPLPSPLKRREPQIVLHPSLPYDFTIYFKDRQVAHVELVYKAVPQPFRKSLLLQRKVSSGNLEVDLLIMRYIGHYLFMRQAWVSSAEWQTVKIDLSAQE